MSSRDLCFSIAIAISIAWVAMLRAAENATVTISILGIEEPGLREQVITDLLQKYDCCILSRSRGYSLYVEQAMDGMVTIDKLAKKLGTPQAADFVVVIRTGRTMQKSETAGELAFGDLRNPSSSVNTKVVKFIEPEVGQVRATIVKTIASTLNLQPPVAAGEGVQSKTNAMAVAILPFTNCDDLDVLGKPRTDKTFEALSLAAC